MRALRELLKRHLSFWRNERGNVLMIFAFALIPMLVSVGVAVDYSLAARSRSHVASAADAAALAGARAAQNYLNSYGTSSYQWAQAITIGKQTANDVYAANQNLANDKLTIQTQAPQITIAPAPDGTALATVTGFGNISTRFMYLVGIPTVNVGSTSQAQGAGISYYQIVFIVDVSNSMAIGGDAATIAALQADSRFYNPAENVNCAFACHDISDKTSYYCHNNPSNKTCAGSGSGSKKIAAQPSYCPSGSAKLQCDYWNDKRSIARDSSPRLYLKIDYIQSALDQFIDQMKSINSNNSLNNVYNQFQISMWAYGTNVNKVFSDSNSSTNGTQQATYFGNARTAADGIDIEASIPSNNNGYTLTSTALTKVYNDAKANLQLGDGSSPAKRKAYFIILSDGAEDVAWPGHNWGRKVVADYPSVCTTMKTPVVAGNDNTRPIIFSIEAQYPDVTGNDQYNTLIVNSQMKTAIPTAMQNCATPGNYLLAENGSQITSAVQTAFAAITASLHLTK
jgi:Flp pilus assembly protein TadG